jgi:hypothetical protein
MSQTIRSLLVVVVGAAVLGFAADHVVRSPGFILPKDFLEYWAAGRLNLRGENPYDPQNLLAEQRTVQPDRANAVMMWNPPPSLALYMPLGLLPAKWASLLWGVTQFAAVMLACFLLAKEYAPGMRWLAPLVAFACVGTWWVITYGQNTGLLVLGLAGFLHFTQRNKPLAAGACAALTALKPHLLAGFGVVLIIDALTHRGRVALASGLSVIAVSLGVALLANPDLVSQFIVAVREPGPGAVALHDWTLPVPAYWLRMELAPSNFLVQFVPCAVACLVLAIWRISAGSAWDWKRALPAIVTLSVLTTPYGGWIFDLPVLLVPAMWCAGRLASARLWVLLGVFLVGQLAIVVVTFATPGALHAYWWVAPASLGLCLLGFVGRGFTAENAEKDRSKQYAVNSAQ